jgi:hypothetical protein
LDAAANPTFVSFRSSTTSSRVADSRSTDPSTEALSTMTIRTLPATVLRSSAAMHFCNNTPEFQFTITISMQLTSFELPLEHRDKLFVWLGIVI